MICPRCHGEINARMDYCPRCGAYIRKKKNKGNTGWIIMIVILLLVLIVLAAVFGMLLYKMERNEKNISEQTVAQSFQDKTKQKVVGIDWNGDVGVAHVQIEAPDLEEIIMDAVDIAILENNTADYDALLCKVRENIQNTLTSKNCPMKSTMLDVEAVKNDDGYSLIENDDLKRAQSGDLEEIFTRFLMEEYKYDD